MRLKKKLEQLEIRTKIAADLHDEVGSSLSSIHLLSAMASKQETTPANKKLLEMMSTNAKETVDKMGDIVWLIKPVEKEGENLRARIERFAMELSEGSGVNVELDLGVLEHILLNHEQRSNIYLIVKEALNNASKYASAKNIQIKVFEMKNLLNIEIADNGIGFDLHDYTPGNGIKNMEGRVRKMGGDFKIKSEINKGTKLMISMPKAKK